MSHEAAKRMIDQGAGEIINMGSMQLFRAGKYIFPYAASKHGAIGLTKVLQADENWNTEILHHMSAGHWGQ